MTVRDLLLECNIEKVAALHFEMQEEPRIDDRKLFLDLHFMFLQDIRKIEPVLGDYLVLGSCISLEDAKEYEVRLYHRSEVREQFVRSAVLEGDWTSMKQLDDTTCARVEEALDLCRLPDHYDMETTPWEKLLGAELFEANLDHLGREEMAACIMQQMTFFGFSNTDYIQGRERIMSAIENTVKEVEWLESLSAEEREKYYIPHDEMIRQLSEDFPELSDELDEDSNDWLARTRIAMVMAYRECLRYMETENGINEETGRAP